MNHAREDAATFIAEYEHDVEQGRRLSVDASAEAVNVLERAVNCIDHQAARIRELEGALARAVRFVEGYRAMHDGSAQDANPGARCACWHCHNSRGIGNSFGSTRPEDARRILAEGSVKP